MLKEMKFHGSFNSYPLFVAYIGTVCDPTFRSGLSYIANRILEVTMCWASKTSHGSSGNLVSSPVLLGCSGTMGSGASSAILDSHVVSYAV